MPRGLLPSPSDLLEVPSSSLPQGPPIDSSLAWQLVNGSISLLSGFGVTQTPLRL